MPVLPSVTVTSLIVSDGVGVVVGDRPDALGVGDRSRSTAFERLTMNVSSASSSRSPLTATVIVLVVSPGAKVSVAARRDVVGRSGGAVAVGRRVVDGHGPAARGARADGEGRVDGAGVALGDGDVVDRERRRARRRR